MRKELEQIQRIEMLLNGQLSGQDKADFEKEIAADPELQADVKAQQLVMSGLQRLLLHTGIKKAAKRFKWTKWLYRGGAGFVGMTIIIFSILFFSNQPAYNGKSHPEYNESGQKNWVYADSAIASQQFFVNGSKDTVIETKGGIVLAIPAGCFLDQNGDSVNGKIEFAVKEALDAATIIKSGLSTTSNSKLLETGGMFFIDARHNGESLKINGKNSIYAQIPADSIRAGMQLFHGQRIANGTINWVGPKPIEHDLVPVDINTLNFYPPIYLPRLAEWGYDITDKRFTDSLYYSFAAFFQARGAMSLLSRVARDSSIGSPETIKWFEQCALNPAKIQAVWNDKFQNTILATQAFEERLHLIHTLYNCTNLFDLYVNNLSKPLYQIDSMAVKYGGEKFSEFAARHDGRVNISSAQLRLLSAYYRIKSRAFTEAAAKTEREYWEKQADLDRKADSRRLKHGTDSAGRAEDNYEKEFDLNLKDAFKQLGYSPTNFGGVAKATYNVQVTVTGWCNVDRYVHESVRNKTTLNFKDQQTGKTAIIKYQPVSFSIADLNSYSRVDVYLLPDKLNSFIRIAEKNQTYKENLNDLFKYNLCCIGYKGGHGFLYVQRDVKPQEYPAFGLAPATDEQIANAINNVAQQKQAEALSNENEYQKLEMLENKRISLIVAKTGLTANVGDIVFPCGPTVMSNGYWTTDSALIRPDEAKQLKIERKVGLK